MPPANQSAAAHSPERMAEILFATDFCRPARAALACVRHVARFRGAPVRALHVLDLTGTTAEQREHGSFSAARDSAECMLREVRHELRHAGISENATLLTGGRPARAIRDAATEYHAAMLVLGINGTRSRKAHTLGATARALLAHCPCPVLTVSSDGPHAGSLLSPERAPVHTPDCHNFDRLIYITDSATGSFSAGFAAWPRAETAPASLSVVLPPNGGRRPAPAGAAPRRSVPRRTLELTGAAATLLAEFEHLAPDLVVLALRAGGYLDSFASGSFAHALITAAPCPVLTVRA